MGLFDAFKKKKEDQVADDLQRLQQQFDAYSMEGRISVDSPVPPQPFAMQPADIDPPPAIAPPSRTVPVPLPMDTPSAESLSPLPPLSLPAREEEEAQLGGHDKAHVESAIEPPPAYDDIPEPALIEERKAPAKKTRAPQEASDDVSARLEKLSHKVEEKVKHKHDERFDELANEGKLLRHKIEKLERRVEDMPLRDLAVRISDVATEKNLLNDKVLELTKKLKDVETQLAQAVASSRQLDVLKDSHETTRKQVAALSESVDSFKNTLYMLNKKTDLIDHTKRVEQIERKIKEIIIYLNKITRIITK